MQRGLSHLRVIDFTSGIAGGVLHEAAGRRRRRRVKVEPPDGDPCATWPAGSADLHGDDGALFRFLHHGKRSVDRRARR